MSVNFFAPDNAAVKVALSDETGNAVISRGTVANLPSAVAGYAVSGIYMATDSGAIYENTGTASSATFTLLDTAATSLQLPEAATDATTTTTVSLDLTQNAVTTGTGFLQTMNGLTTGVGHSIAHTTAVIASGGSLMRLSSTSVDTSTTTGVLLDLSSTASLAGTQILGTFSGLTTGKGLSLVAGAQTTGSLVALSGGGSNLTTNGKVLEVSMGTSTSGMGVQITNTGAFTGNGGNAPLIVTANTSSACTAGLVQISGTGSISGILIRAAAAQATMTTGRYFSANDSATEVFGIGANGHIHSTVSAAPPTIAVSQQNGITAAAITAGGTDTCGVITTTGTNNNSGSTILQVTFGKTYTTAPKGVMLMPANAAAAKMSSSSVVGVYVSATAATTFDITIPADSTAQATPSFRYMVIQ